jgi:hypothetical protein
VEQKETAKSKAIVPKI